jgi:hypothetical protein
MLTFTTFAIQVNKLIAFTNKIASWFSASWVVIKLAFSSPQYGIYLSLGFLICHLFNILIYAARGVPDLQTWFYLFGLSDYKPSVKYTIFLSFVLSMLVFISFQNILYKISRYDVDKYVNVSLFYSFFICGISQLVTSSAIRFVYELSFCIIVFFSYLLTNVFIQPIQGENMKRIELYRELWDYLKFIFKAAFGFPIITAGASLIQIFYQGESEFIKVQIYRIVTMSLYYMIGTLLFLILPTTKKLISMRKLLY